LSARADDGKFPIDVLREIRDKAIPETGNCLALVVYCKGPKRNEWRSSNCQFTISIRVGSHLKLISQKRGSRGT
jgi:hypothetical protein